MSVIAQFMRQIPVDRQHPPPYRLLGIPADEHHGASSQPESARGFRETVRSPSLPSPLRRSRQFPIGKSHSRHKLRECVSEHELVFSIVKPVFQLVQIGVQMLHAHAMKRADDTAFQQAPNALNAVRVNLSAHPLLFPVVHRLMHRVRVANARVGRKLVRVDGLRIGRGVVCDELVENRLTRVMNDLQANLAPALNGTDSDGLVSAIPAPHAANLAANVSLVHFHDAAQKLGVGVPDCRTDAVAQMPCSLIGDAKGALHLQGADSLLRFSHEKDCHEPLHERQMAIMEDRPARGGKLIAALVAVVLVALRNGGDAFALAARASDAIGPAELDEPRAALGITAEHLHEPREVHLRFFVSESFHI